MFSSSVQQEIQTAERIGKLNITSTIMGERDTRVKGSGAIEGALAPKIS